MVQYKKQFDDLTAAAIQALNLKRDELRNVFFGMEPAYVRRLLERISANLQRVDENRINHPTYLASRGQFAPQRAIDLISSMPSAITDSGVTHFVIATLPELVEVDEALSKAAGINEVRSAEIKSSQLRAIERYVDWAKLNSNSLSASRQNAEKSAADSSKDRDQIAKLVADAQADAKKIQDIRTQALRLGSGTKTSPPLSSIIKDAQDKVVEVEAMKNGIADSRNDLEKVVSRIDQISKLAESAIENLELHEKQAKGILNNATQAGLAGAYKIEREKLAKQQLYYAGAFYGIILSVVLYAAFFIVPIASKIIVNNEHSSTTIGESALLLFVRILIVLPAFWALIFTNKRFVYLETLQMDYAAKAATALAYSGYRDEMEEDTALSHRLKDGLVARFVEHPSRLLGDKIESSISIIDNDGTKVISETHSPKAKSQSVDAQSGE